MSTLGLLCTLFAVQELVSDGVLGNSGGQGKTLVRFGPQVRTGLGAPADRYGTIWDRAGSGLLNRYAPDGRRLSSHPIPADGDDRDRAAVCGELLVLRLRGQLLTLPLDAADGAEPRPLGLEAELLSSNSHQGRLALVRKGVLALFDPVSRDLRELAKVGEAQEVELDGDGAAYVSSRGKLRKFVDGREVTEGWPKPGPGERPQFVDGAWWGHAWHGTIRRFTARLEPDPGVVLGGSSGSFIGHLDQNSELDNGRGLSKLGNGLFAISGRAGILHLASWDAERRQLTLVRRIGAVPYCRGLGLDRKGRVWFHSGVWQWHDGPDAPLLEGVNAPEAPGLGQIVMLDNDGMLGVGGLWGKTAVYSGPLSDEAKVRTLEKSGPPGALTGAAQIGGRLLTVDAAGRAQALKAGGDGLPQGEASAVSFQTSGPVKTWTSLAVKDAATLLAGTDAGVVEFSAAGADWKETRRWSSWGADRFGGPVWISADAGRLWVSDSERHRVLCFDLATGKPLAEHGGPEALSRPQVIAGRERRAVVFDSGHQRLVKLILR